MISRRRAILSGASLLTLAVAGSGCGRGRSPGAAQTDGGGDAGQTTGGEQQPKTAATAASAPALLELKGTARVRGQAHGASQKPAIQASVAEFMSLTASLRASADGIATWDTTLDAAIKRVADVPALVEEVEGIQAESGVEARAHWAYVLSDELLGLQNPGIAQNWLDRWSASEVVAVPNKSGQVTRILFRMGSAGQLLIHDHLGPNGEKIALIVSRPGSLGCFGVNDSGFACAYQPLVPTTMRGDGQGSVTLFRKLLGATTHHEAVARAKARGSITSSGYFVADPTNAIAVESREAGVRAIGVFSGSAVVAHTNHVVGPLADAHPTSKRSLARLKVLRDLVPRGADPTLKELIAMYKKTAANGAIDPSNPIFAANLKPTKTQLSWRT